MTDVAVTFAPVHTLFILSAYGVLPVVRVDTERTPYADRMNNIYTGANITATSGIHATSTLTTGRTPYAGRMNNIYTGVNVTASSGIHNQATSIETKRTDIIQWLISERRIDKC
jgi:preprotein translocase subunit YajC